MVDARRLDEAVRDAFEAEQVPLLRELVERPSCSREVEDVEVVLARLDHAASSLGLGVEVVPAGPHEVASHRVYATPAALDPAAPSILLVGHADTVFPRSLGFTGFRREGERVFGPGVLDMKSGLTSILAALRALARVDARAFAALPVRVVVVSDEEIGSISSRALYERLAPHAASALVFESGRMHDHVVTARKGGGYFELVALGRAAHAGNRHAEGVNAIHALACAVLKLEALTRYETGLTVSVGMIDGGTAKNTVPERARCAIDVRFRELADVRRFRDALASIVEAPFEGIDARWLNERVLRAHLESSGDVTRPPMEPGEATTRLRLAYEAHAQAVGLGIGEAPLQGGGSDANLLAAAGVPSIDGLGPFGEFFHETREWASLESLRQKTEALARFLAEAATTERVTP